MAIRKAEAEWKGTLREGTGTIKVGSGLFTGPYSFPSRFEEQKGTNPEELIGAALAGCFSMALSAGLTKAGHNPTRIYSTAAVHLDKTGDGFSVTKIELTCEGDVAGLDQDSFIQYATEAKKGCPISRALAGVEITLKASLTQAAHR